MAVPDIAELLTMSQAQVMLAASTAYIAPPSKEVCWRIDAPMHETFPLPLLYKKPP